MTQVLIVDDHASIRQAIKWLLESKEPKWQIVEAQNGLEALKLIGKHVPDVALVDLMMPEMDGFALCQKLADLKIKLPVIILTAKADVESEERLRQIYQPEAFVIKPVDNQQLYQLVKQTIEKGKEAKKK